MHKKTKIFISLFLIFTFSILFQTSFAKYVIEDINIIAKLDIDGHKPDIELTDIISSNTNYSTYANKTHLITGHIKIIEKNIVRNELSPNHIKIAISDHFIIPEFKSFSLISENATEKIYEFSFTNTIGDGPLTIVIPSGIVEDKSGLINEQKYFSTGISIDNTPPIVTFQETASLLDGKSKAEITSNESIQPMSGWSILNHNMLLSKEFTNSISYSLPVMDYAQNSSDVLVHIQKATNILLQYGTYDAHSKKTLVTGGKISAPDTISSHSICKSEAIFMKLSGNLDSSILEGRCYLYTHWGNGARGICQYSKLSYEHGYNPNSNSEWIDSKNSKLTPYFKDQFTQLGSIGLNVANKTSLNIKTPIPNHIAKQYLYGISGIQFRLKNNSNFSIVYQSYVKDIGWLKASCNGQENLYQHNKPISAFRMNLVPQTEKQYLIDFWNRDVGTDHIN